MAQMSDGIGEEILQSHLGAEARIPTRGIVHRKRPLTRTDVLQPRENGLMALVEFPEHARLTQSARRRTWANRIDPVKQGCAQVKERCKSPAARAREVTEHGEQPSKREDKEEPEKYMEEQLPIGPTGIEAGLVPATLSYRCSHDVKLLPRGLEL